MSNRRLISIDNDVIKFAYKDYRDGGKRKVATLPAVEFIDRFLSHVLPQGMRHVRHYGFLTPTRRTENLKTIRNLLSATEQDNEAPRQSGEFNDSETEDREVEDQRESACPHCGEKTLVRGQESPRPTVAEIMQMPLQKTHSQRWLELDFP